MGAGLQSGFVLAVVLAAVLFAGRWLPGDELAQRFVQVAIGVVLALAVFGGTTAFIRQPSPPPSSSSSSSNEDTAQRTFIREANKKATLAATLNVAAGALLVIAGLSALRRFRVVPYGWALGGVLLLLFGGVGSGSGNASDLFAFGYASFLGAFLATGDRTTDIVRFVVLLLTAVGLTLFAVLEYEPRTNDAVEPETVWRSG
jgi:hypothetical protein